MHALIDKSPSATPLHALNISAYKSWLSKQSAHTKEWLSANHFECAEGKFALVPDAKGKLALVVAGINDAPHIWSIAALSAALPAQAYKLEGHFSNSQTTQLALGWVLGSYQFTRYKKSQKKFAQLVLPKGADAAFVRAAADSIFLARDLINTPTNDMLPSDLAKAAGDIAKKHGAKVKVIVGDELLKQNYPTIYAVGKASANPPRLVDIRWGKPGAPKVTLVGKGVCFDSGGLDIKSASGMKLMKKDMAGAAIMLALGNLIMARKLNVQLRLLLPMVENAISGNAMRPMDIIKTRKGITVEIENTDAEGRLILCDALAEADSGKPNLIIDCATLTGAARVALGTDIPAFFTPDDKLALKLAKHAEAERDPLWRLPLWADYRDMLNSKTADMMNSSESGYAGAITAALYLKEFVSDTKSWIHVDTMAWNLNNRPGRPVGGEAQTLRSLFALIEELYG